MVDLFVLVDSRFVSTVMDGNVSDRGTDKRGDWVEIEELTDEEFEDREEFWSRASVSQVDSERKVGGNNDDRDCSSELRSNPNTCQLSEDTREEQVEEFCDFSDFDSNPNAEKLNSRTEEGENEEFGDFSDFCSNSNVNGLEIGEGERDNEELRDLNTCQNLERLGMVQEAEKKDKDACLFGSDDTLEMNQSNDDSHGVKGGRFGNMSSIRSNPSVKKLNVGEKEGNDEEFGDFSGFSSNQNVSEQSGGKEEGNDDEFGDFSGFSSNQNVSEQSGGKEEVKSLETEFNAESEYSTMKSTVNDNEKEPGEGSELYSGLDYDSKVKCDLETAVHRGATSEDNACVFKSDEIECESDSSVKEASGEDYDFGEFADFDSSTKNKIDERIDYKELEAKAECQFDTMSPGAKESSSSEPHAYNDSKKQEKFLSRSGEKLGKKDSVAPVSTLSDEDVISQASNFVRTFLPTFEGSLSDESTTEAFTESLDELVCNHGKSGGIHSNISKMWSSLIVAANRVSEDEGSPQLSAASSENANLNRFTKLSVNDLLFDKDSRTSSIASLSSAWTGFRCFVWDKSESMQCVRESLNLEYMEPDICKCEDVNTILCLFYFVFVLIPLGPCMYAFQRKKISHRRSRLNWVFWSR